MERLGPCNAMRVAPSRRGLLLGATALLSLAGAAQANAAGRVTIAALVDGAGRATARAEAMDGAIVTLIGYLAPPLTSGESWLIGEGPAVPCQLCGEMHDIGATMAVTTDKPLDPVPSPAQAVALIGRLDLAGTAPRLVAARLSGA
jgi:hypothetical protein